MVDLIFMLNLIKNHVNFFLEILGSLQFKIYFYRLGCKSFVFLNNPHSRELHNFVQLDLFYLYWIVFYTFQFCLIEILRAAQLPSHISLSKENFSCNILCHCLKNSIITTLSSIIYNWTFKYPFSVFFLHKKVLKNFLIFKRMESRKKLNESLENSLKNHFTELYNFLTNKVLFLQIRDFKQN